MTIEWLLLFGLFLMAAGLIDVACRRIAARRRRNRYLLCALPQPRPDPRNWSRAFMESPH